MRTVADLIAAGASRLPVDNPRREARLLLARVLGRDPDRLYLRPDELVSAGEEELFFKLISERGALRRPLQYILGTAEFMSLEFEVGPGVMVPRPETEILVERALEVIGGRAVSILDVGTGSGAIAVSLLVYAPRARAMATDLSPRALGIAARNAARHGVADRVEFRCGDLLEPVRGQSFDLVAANLPYIPTGDLAGLEPEVREHEPRLALDGGPDGLDLYRKLIPGVPAALAEGGALLVEISPGQARDVADMMLQAGLVGLEVLSDYSGRDRVVLGRRRVKSASGERD